jgi:pimeloyl-ACP methyl ester carboxylesterase
MGGDNSELRVIARIDGHGPGVLFIHGWNHSRRIWNATISELRGEVTSVAIDLPGFGESPPLPLQQITLSHFSLLTARIIRATAQALEERNSSLHTVVGDSLGALFILELFQNDSKLVERELLDAEVYLTPLEGDSRYGSGSRSETAKPVLRGVDRIVLSGCPSDGLPPYVSALKNLNIIRSGLNTFSSIPQWASKSVLRVLSLGTVHRFKDVSDDLIESVLQANPQTSEILFKEIANYSYESDQLTEASFNSNVQVVRGEWDRITSESESRALANHFQGTYHEVPGVGHTLMIEAPDAYARIVKGKYPG